MYVHVYVSVLCACGGPFYSQATEQPQVCATLPCFVVAFFNVRDGDPSSGPQASIAGTLTTEQLRQTVLYVEVNIMSTFLHNYKYTEFLIFV